MAQRYRPTDVRRAQIAEAALELLAAHGVDGFTTRAIATRVGITDGAIFGHFTDTAEIVLAALELLEGRMFSVVPRNSDPLLRLGAMFRHRASFVAGESLLGRLVLSGQLIHAGGEPARGKVRGWQRRNLAFISNALSELAKTGRLRSSRSVAQLVPIVHGMLLTFAFERVVNGPLSDTALEKKVGARWDTFCSLMIKEPNEDGWLYDTAGRGRDCACTDRLGLRVGEFGQPTRSKHPRSG